MPTIFPVTEPVRPSENLMTPVTFGPLCVNTTSPLPKSLPVVHHLPSMLAVRPAATAVLGVLAFDERALGLGAVVVDAVGLVGLLTGLVDFAGAAPVVIVPPPV